MKILIINDIPIADTQLEKFRQAAICELVITNHDEDLWRQLLSPQSAEFVVINHRQTTSNKLKLIRSIRENDKILQPYIILTTNLSGEHDLKPIIEARIDDYIAHPFHPKELETRLSIAKRILHLQTRLLNKQRILSNEREIIENILQRMRNSKPFYSDNIRFIDNPVESTSGDILLSSCKPNNTHHLLLGDFTGHGLTAAVCGPIVFDVFYSMTQKNLAMTEIVEEINRQLLEKMPTRLFMAGVFIELNRHNNTLRIWNCGMSDVLIYRKDKLLLRFSSSFLSLGIVEQNFNEATETVVQQGDKIYAFSDGITECTNEKCEEFGQNNLEQYLSCLLQQNLALDKLATNVKKFRGQQAQVDDITLVELTC